MYTRANSMSLNLYAGKIVMLCGWITTLRRQKNVTFIIVRDSHGETQVVVDTPALLTGVVPTLSLESTVKIVGEVVTNASVKLHGVEVVAQSIEVLSKAQTPLPIDKDSSLELQLDWRHLSLRNQKMRFVFQIQTAIEHAMRDFWHKEQFIEIHSPKLMPGASEGGAELFSLEYFGLGKAALAQSPQFYKQMAMAAGFDRVFEIGPVFRANPSFTSRHDTEFTSVDVEMSWIENVTEVIEHEERWLRFIFESIAKPYGAVIESIFGERFEVPTLPFPRITMSEAQEILIAEGFTPASPDDLEPEAEKRLSAYVKERFKHDFVFVTNFPARARPFYTKVVEDSALSTGYDLLYRGVEITSGAQREHRYEQLENAIRSRGITVEGVRDYLNFFKYGVPPHGGFGFGLSRFLMKLLGFKNVREVTYLYRGPNRLSP